MTNAKYTFFVEKSLDEIYFLGYSIANIQKCRFSNHKFVEGEITMNTYEISIQRENGTTCTDRVVAATPAEAKKFFREIYRHGEAFQSKDLKVELVSENIPATKDREREAPGENQGHRGEPGPGQLCGNRLRGVL